MTRQVAFERLHHFRDLGGHRPDRVELCAETVEQLRSRRLTDEGR
ncbi:MULTISPECIES: hypothetical protein [unclassified Streptomyces]